MNNYQQNIYSYVVSYVTNTENKHRKLKNVKAYAAIASSKQIVT